MKAIFFEEHGGPEVLRYGEVKDPTVNPGEALIRVRAVALNHLDIWVRKGWKGLKIQMPHIGGSDIAGEIISVNSASTQWTPGTNVIINPGINTVEDRWTRTGEDSLSPGYRIIGEQIPGGLAELVAVPVSNVYRMPSHLDFPDAAAPLLVGVTCWRMLLKRANLCAGETMLVVGAGGGVNSLSTQIARSVGASVIALAGSKDKGERALELGAEHFIDYSKTPNWAVEVLKLTKGLGVDVVVDNVGAATIPESLRAAARGGRIVTVGNTSGHQITFDNRMIFTKQLSLLGSTMGSKQDFIDAMEYLWKHKISIPIDRVERLKDGIKMLQYLESGEQFGKILLRTD